MVKREIIDGVEVFRGLNLASREELAARAVSRRFPRGGRLWTAGAEPRGLFILLDGRVRIVRTSGRRQHVLHSEGPGATLGEVPLFSGGTYPATAIAEEPSVCLVIDRAGLALAMTADSRLAWTLLAGLADRVRHLVDRLSAQTADPVSARLAAYLLSRPRREDGTITLGGTQEQVAEEIGTVREVVVRMLRQWCDEGVLASSARGSYVVSSEPRLRRYSCRSATSGSTAIARRAGT
jgi:CRP-like cAMP-binding protein